MQKHVEHHNSLCQIRLHKLIEIQQYLWSFYGVFVFWDITAQLQQFTVLIGNSFGKFRWLQCLLKESNPIVGPYQ